MFFSRASSVVFLISGIVIVLLLSASFSASQRIRDWQTEFATTSEDPSFRSSSLLLEHHRLLNAMASYARDEEQVSKADLQHRLDIYWSRYNLLNSGADVFSVSKIALEMTGLPPDSHSQILAASLDHIRTDLGDALQDVDRQIKLLEPGDYQAYMNVRVVLDAFSDSLSKLQIASFERQRYLNQVQIALSEELRLQLINALLVISAGIILLSFMIMLYLRQKQLATENLKDVNLQLHSKIRESERLGKELSFRARHDSLSGLINRFGFTQELGSLLNTGEGSHGLCFVDLDLFKVVNDTCGHAAGDELIREVARLLCLTLPDDAVVARFGGDEFVILLPDCEQSTFVELINACCTDLKEFIFIYSGQRFDVTGSFGATYFNASEFDGQTLLGIADAACYEAKNAGGSRVHFHHAGDDIVEMRQHDLYWVANIRDALENRRFCLFKQPIVALNEDVSGRPDHWEVLVRMVGENDELTTPGEFLDVAERYLLSPRLDRLVIEETFAWLNNRYKSEVCCEYVNINLSGVSIGDIDFLSHIEKMTLNLAIPTSNVCFEITETAAMGKHARKFLSRLKELGYRLALDDFGSGFSSFGYLESLPVDYIKIDGLFVRDMNDNLTHREFVKSINDIGKVMGKQTIAEYVESPESLSILKDMGVDFAQGHFIARPSPIAMPGNKDRLSRLTA